MRGAISIARRLQDPLAELVKVDPKSIGVGQYQHDVSQPALKRSLEHVVESCVNQVGVNLNTASYHLLAHVAGIGPSLARSIVEHRGQKGLFRSRQQLLDVPRFSQKAFEQAAGFLRVPESEHPLDRTGVHPERYPLLETQAKKLGCDVKELMGEGVARLRQDREFRAEVGEFTFQDIVQELEKPGRDPREEFVPFQYRDDIHEVKDLKDGMICPGIVTNVTNFGAFVDIGVHQDGLVHLSQLAEKYVQDPRQVVSPGDRVQVRVLGVDLKKNQIALSLRLTDSPRERGGRRDAEGGREGKRGPRRDDRRGPRGEGGKAPRRDGERGPRPDGDRGPRRDDERAAKAAPQGGFRRPEELAGGGGFRRDGDRGPRPGGMSGPRFGGDRGPRHGSVGGPRRDDDRVPRRDEDRGPRSHVDRPAGGKNASPFNNALAGLAALRDQLKK